MTVFVSSFLRFAYFLRCLTLGFTKLNHINNKSKIQDNHCTKNEEIHNKKLHFLSSESI